MTAMPGERHLTAHKTGRIFSQNMTNSIIKFLFIFTFTLSLRALAQSVDPHDVQPERPTVATHAGTVAPGWLEIEAGGEFDYYENQSNGFNLPANIKVGVTSDIQINLFSSAVRPPHTSDLQAGDFAVGVKWRIFDDFPILEKFAILPIVKLPTGPTASGAGTGTVDGSILLISSHEIGPIALDINLGFTHRSDRGNGVPLNSSLWTISFGGPLISAFGWVAEFYGYPGTSGESGQSPIVATLIGPTVTAYSWLVFDFGCIVPIKGSQPSAVYFGCVYNIGKIID